MISLDLQLNRYFNGFFKGVQAMLPEKAQTTALQLIAEFNAYMDALARSNPSMYHHVYEWNMVGEPAGRLFQLRVFPKPNGAIITYELLQSVIPNNNGVVFANKATIMESGADVTFTTEKPVPIADDTFRVGEFTFIPGGPDTNDAFRQAFIGYFASRPMPRNKDITISASGNSESAGYRDARRLLQ
jgi:hypothetical protein